MTTKILTDSNGKVIMLSGKAIDASNITGVEPEPGSEPVPEVVHTLIKNQDKTITTNGTYTYDSGYTGLGTVTVYIAGCGTNDSTGRVGTAIMFICESYVYDLYSNIILSMLDDQFQVDFKANAFYDSEIDGYYLTYIFPQGTLPITPGSIDENGYIIAHAICDGVDKEVIFLASGQMGISIPVAEIIENQVEAE